MFSGGVTVTKDQNAKLVEYSNQLSALADEAQKVREGLNPLTEESIATTQAHTELNEQMVDGENEASELGQTAQDAYNANQIADENLSTAKTDESYARQESTSKDGEARNRELELKQKQEGRTSFTRQNEDLARNVVTQRNELATLQDRAKFFKDMYKRELFNQFEMACIQTALENQNFGGELLCSFQAACMKMADAELGTRTNASPIFQKQRYFTVGERVDGKTADSAANEVKGQASRVSDLENQLAEKTSDSFHDGEVAKAEKELAEAMAKKDGENSNYADAKAAAEEAKTERDAAKEQLTDAQKAQREKEAENRKLQKEAKRLEAEDAKNRAEQQKINAELQRIGTKQENVKRKYEDVINEASVDKKP